jgi:transposase
MGKHSAETQRTQPICLSRHRARKLVECFFNKIKQCRPVVKRHDKLAANYFAFPACANPAALPALISHQYLDGLIGF